MNRTFMEIPSLVDKIQDMIACETKVKSEASKRGVMDMRKSLPI